MQSIVFPVAKRSHQMIVIILSKIQFQLKSLVLTGMYVWVYKA